MSYISYKALVAQRLAIDPNELLMYYENNGKVYATTPDGVQHSYTYEQLNRPAKKPAEVQLRPTTNVAPPSKPKPKK